MSKRPPKKPLTRKPLSPRQLAANRKNAKKSTGPRTRAGKRRSARNAIKHGLLAREVVVTTGDGAERAEEFHALLRDFVTDLKPVGPIEEVESGGCSHLPSPFADKAPSAHVISLLTDVRPRFVVRLEQWPWTSPRRHARVARLDPEWQGSSPVASPAIAGQTARMRQRQVQAPALPGFPL